MVICARSTLIAIDTIYKGESLKILNMLCYLKAKKWTQLS